MLKKIEKIFKILKILKNFKKIDQILKKFLKMFILIYYFQIIFLTNYVSDKIEGHIPPQSTAAKNWGAHAPKLQERL